ncbi:MAG: hypothetical protein U0K80_04735 [Methanobrevibacter sp.]|nr:hypothetical protein [Methanobrevibacter sp.]
MKLDQLKENWSNQPIIIRILFILLIIAFIYDLITGIAFSIFFSVILLLFIIAEIYYWFINRKKE